MKRRAACAVVVGVLALTGCGESGPSLAFGEKATVTGDRSGSVGVTVVRVEKGTHADLSRLEDAAKYAGKTPYYVRFKLTKTAAGNDDDETSHFEVYADGKPLSELIILPSLQPTGDPSEPLTSGRFDKCEGADHTRYKEAAEGQSVDGCTVFVAPDSAAAPSTVKWTRRSKTLATWKAAS
ncbi:hypothetical protein GCM10010218_44990 [Streptomyces mashuensis]|uniref:Lipoprotein n=1 Tax=Streptomyces mashuensis TaxID=33904 RepID=A0A919B6H8_9ACTN|nr:hypothetical protein [Streptomyces mashuensis]GHF58677.1 hypothetical protein GCM10010218_44990 [Streptomyces mashuensis]